MVTRKFAAFCAAALMALGSTRSAEALNILPADVGASWSYTQTSNVAGVTADFEWEVASFLFDGVNTTVVFDITVENTSTVNSDLRAFSVVTPGPDAIGGSISGSAIFDTLSVDLSPPAAEAFDVCAATTSTPNCNGISEAGLADGAPAESVTLSLVFAGNVTTGGINLENFCSRWQAVGPNSQDSAKGCDTGENFTPVPEPGSLALLGAGIAAVAARRARRKRAEV